MQIIFMDEAGYSFNWESNLDEQPFYVLSAVCLSSENLSIVYKNIREEVVNLNLGSSVPLGHGFEIKAREVATGSGYWKTNNDKRNAMRDLMLEVPKKHADAAFVVVIDKVSHKKQYAKPENPYELALEFIFERLQMFLLDKNDYGICIYDQNKRLEDTLHDTATDFIHKGTDLMYFSRFYEGLVIRKFKIDRIIDFSFGRSENSVGLQIADFFASMTYAYVKGGKPSACGWWDVLKSSLYQKDGKLDGVGFKQFP